MPALQCHACLLREINERSVRVIRHGRLVELQSRQVEVGDVVHLQEDEVVPCDAVVLATSHTHGQCYVMTANLDGETSLKTRTAAAITKVTPVASYVLSQVFLLAPVKKWHTCT
jgi:P-type E1-E2 ATPase